MLDKYISKFAVPLLKRIEFFHAKNQVCTSKGSKKRKKVSLAHDNLCNVLSSVDQVDADAEVMALAWFIVAKSVIVQPGLGTYWAQFIAVASMKCSKLSNLYSAMRQKARMNCASWARIFLIVRH